MSGPRAGPGKERIRADTQVGPYRVDCNTQQAQRNGRGRSPAPTELPGVPSSGPMYLRHDLRPYGEKGTPNRPSGSAAQSGASAAWMGGMGGHRGKCPATSDNPSVAAKPRQLPLHKGAFGLRGTGRTSLGHRSSQQPQAGRDRARPLQKGGEYAEGWGDERPMPVRDLPGCRQLRFPQSGVLGMTTGAKASSSRPTSQRPS